MNFNFETTFSELPEDFDLADLNIQIERVGHYGCYGASDYNGHGRWASWFIVDVTIGSTKSSISITSAIDESGKFNGELCLDADNDQTNMFIQKFKNQDEEDDLSCVLELIEAEIVDLLQDEFNAEWEDFDELAQN